jgi:biotin carboxylase
MAGRSRLKRDAMSERYCAIVDAYSTASELPRLLHGYGYRCVHVQSSEEFIDVYRASFRPLDFAAHIVHRGDVEQTLRDLAKFPVEFIIAGAEPGVELADALSDRTGLTANVLALSAARRDKYRMSEALRLAGLRTAESRCAQSAQEAVDWATSRGSWPVVVKPPRSAGSDDVFFCRSAEEVRHAFALIHRKRNRLGERNAVVLCQECLDGQEMIVDSVSYEGRHYLSEIWSVRKRRLANGSIAYDLEVLEDAGAEAFAGLRDYVRQALTALGIRFGPAHSELCITSRGPTLIEAGARMHGGISSSAVAAGLGYNHPTLTAECYAQPQRFLERFSNGSGGMRRHVFVVTFISRQRGRVIGYTGLEEIRKLRSYHSELGVLGVGSELLETVDLFTSPGIVYLVHDDRAVLEDDYQRIRSIEDRGLFALNSDPA